ncbi:MAG: hypothetical protein ACOCV2_15550, partial [Persicimonas sp.]
TGFSFETVDESGRPTGVRELPIVSPTAVTEGPRLSELIEASHAGHHQAIGWALDPEIFADYPDMERFEEWLSTFEVARQHDHVITNVARFERFQRLRRVGRLQSELVDEVEIEDRRDADDDDDDADDAGETTEATRLRIEAEAKERGMSIAVPAEFDEKRLHAIQKGGSRHGADIISEDLDSVPADLVGYELRRIPLDAGHNRLDLYYR